MNTVIAVIMSAAIAFSNASFMETKETYVDYGPNEIHVQEKTTWDFTGKSIVNSYTVSYDEWNSR